MSLFHQPSFQDKISSIEDPKHLIALFAAMFSISSRFAPRRNTMQGLNTSTSTSPSPSALDGSNLPSHKEFHVLSLKYINEAMDACSNSPPPLCLVQAMTLAGFYSLVNGVYGQAWRLVGAAVRVAYELRLHLIDHEGLNKAPSSDNELTAWSFSEERRRCWWALWEMDIFASTIKRAPTAIDWKMNETYLPVSDDLWFANKYQASCLLRGEPEERWRHLKQSGNEGSFAWAILLAALMRDAQILCHDNLQGKFANLDPKSDVPKLVQYFSNSYTRQAAEEISERLSSLVRAYQAIREELPAALEHGGEPLNFDLVAGEDPLAARRASAGKYIVGMMKASASFMIYQNHVVADMIEGLIPLPLFSSPEVPTQSSDQSTVMGDDPTTRVGLENFLEASDTVLRLLTSCPGDHVRYVSPYYASTVWIAATLQSFKRIFRWNEAPMLTESKYATLRQTYMRFAEFWGTPLTLLQNLDSLEARLEARQKEMEMSGPEPVTNPTGGAHALGMDMLGGGGGGGEGLGAVEAIRQPQPPGLLQSASVPYEASQFSGAVDAPSALRSPDESLEWSSAMGGEVDPSTDDSAFTGDWSGPFPDDLFVDNFAWYSSDIMAALCHGYAG
ncbi:hypothetical protein A1O3_02013 [Capronia epimyces CBS 606.96]|uniref:Xylanolytic transcriptional activator regulatory domain-containing protein n=1 Tax=Capronia epimyces CBS 606.96 TaxID=1182542 RepID=W9Z376_9EURO|nr:uncharacterized protein A1O3_02013 [Capronia epimyces CBS 606.96]EXJ88949.1 hypothetical protein A1O3_02013 [Capronia epimyces CBS 606.96]